MIKTLIIEDEAYIRTGLISFIEQLDKGIDIIGECESVQEAITVAKACKPDLIFLDIHLRDGNSFEFLEKTSQLDYCIVFITADAEHALPALKKGAVDYILKPVDIDELSEAIDKALSSIAVKTSQKRSSHPQTATKKGKEKLVLRLQDGLQIIDLQELRYCKSDKGYTTFYLTNGRTFLASRPIKDFEPQLPADMFFRTHQSYCVNLNFIDKYDKNGYAILKDGESIPVASRKKESFVALLLKGNS
ncbi:DNA-binding response regulator [marine bacterium AO1-C]|nr:DNA-binding response regulator [marine bacterium AO1-C]